MAAPLLPRKVSAVDTAWLRMDRPQNLMMMTGVLTFRERLSMAKVRRVVFQGAYVEYLTDIEGQECVFLDTDYYKTGVAEVGQTLGLSIDNRPVWILPENEAVTLGKAA